MSPMTLLPSEVRVPPNTRHTECRLGVAGLPVLPAMIEFTKVMEPPRIAIPPPPKMLASFAVIVVFVIVRSLSPAPVKSIPPPRPDRLPLIVELTIVVGLALKMPPPTPTPETFPLMVDLRTINVTPLLKIPPPAELALLSLTVEISMVNVPVPSLAIPPPACALLLPLMVERSMSAVLAFQIPPPSSPALLPLIVESVTVRVPPETLAMPPPKKSVLLPEITLLETVSRPELKMAPPMLPPPVTFPFVSVSPEMEAVTPLLTLKMRLLALPLMVSDAAPGPEMVRSLSDYQPTGQERDRAGDAEIDGVARTCGDDLSPQRARPGVGGVGHGQGRRACRTKGSGERAHG